MISVLFKAFLTTLILISIGLLLRFIVFHIHTATPLVELASIYLNYRPTLICIKVIKKVESRFALIWGSKIMTENEARTQNYNENQDTFLTLTDNFKLSKVDVNIEVSPSIIAFGVPNPNYKITVNNTQEQIKNITVSSILSSLTDKNLTRIEELELQPHETKTFEYSDFDMVDSQKKKDAIVITVERPKTKFEEFWRVLLMILMLAFLVVAIFFGGGKLLKLMKFLGPKVHKTKTYKFKRQETLICPKCKQLTSNFISELKNWECSNCNVQFS